MAMDDPIIRKYLPEDCQPGKAFNRKYLFNVSVQVSSIGVGGSDFVTKFE